LDRTVTAFHRVEKAMGTDDTSKLPAVYCDINRQELLLDGLRNGKITFEDGYDNDSDVFHYISHFVALGNSNPFGLTMFLFTPTLKLQGSDEQVAYWLPLAEAGKIIGSYAQTE
jgi:acyl-CoA oxidase